MSTSSTNTQPFISLSKWVEKDQKDLNAKYGVFYAFSKEQFDERRQAGVQYVSLQCGGICPVENQLTYLQERRRLFDTAKADHLETYGLDRVILHALRNFECFYSGDISDAIDYLKDYEGATTEKIAAVYGASYEEEVENL